jgi:hypothetical protein
MLMNIFDTDRTGIAFTAFVPLKPLVQAAALSATKNSQDCGNT